MGTYPLWEISVYGSHATSSGQFHVSILTPSGVYSPPLPPPVNDASSVSITASLWLVGKGTNKVQNGEFAKFFTMSARFCCPVKFGKLTIDGKDGLKWANLPCRVWPPNIDTCARDASAADGCYPDHHANDTSAHGDSTPPPPVFASSKVDRYWAR